MANHKGDDKHQHERETKAEHEREAKAQAARDKAEQKAQHEAKADAEKAAAEQAAVEQGPSRLVEERMVAGDTSVMEAQERQWDEDPHPEAQRQRFEAERPMQPGPDGMMKPPKIDMVDLDGGFVLAVMSVEADPNAPNLAGRVRVRTILAMDREGLEQRIATTLVSDFGILPEAAEAIATGKPPPKPAVSQDGTMLTDDQRRDAAQPGHPEPQPMREA